ncbi:MAG: Crp/Fnr family transcriptional regulator [Thermodesulfobacteriota bacterium]
MTSHDLTSSLVIATEERYGDGDIIFEEGAAGDWIYVIVSGEIEIFKNIRGKKIVVDRLKKGELFGEVSFVDKEPRSAGARAIGTTVLGIYDRTFLTEQYNRLPNDFRMIFDAMARRLRKMTMVAVNLASTK